jgi:hypothetical protein
MSTLIPMKQQPVAQRRHKLNSVHVCVAENCGRTRQDFENEESRASLRKLEIRSKHRLGSQGGVPDDIVDVEEQPREPFCKVCQETLRHRT